MLERYFNFYPLNLKVMSEITNSYIRVILEDQNNNCDLMLSVLKKLCKIGPRSEHRKKVVKVKLLFNGKINCLDCNTLKL